MGMARAILRLIKNLLKYEYIQVTSLQQNVKSIMQKLTSHDLVSVSGVNFVAELVYHLCSDSITFR